MTTTGRMDEHADKGLDSKAPVKEYEPTPAEEKAIKSVEKQYQRLKMERQPWEEKWVDFYRFFRGWQWKESRPGFRHSEVINFVFKAIQGQVPILTDSRPRVEYLPKEPSDREFASIMNAMFESDFISENWLFKLTEMIYDAEIFGTGHGKIDFDPEKMFGLGKMVFESRDNFNIYPDVDAVDVNEKCDVFIDAEPMELEKAKRMWPDKADFLKADLEDLTREYRRDMYDTEVYTRPASIYMPRVPSNYHDTKRVHNKVLVITMYVRDNQIVENKIKVKDKEGKERDVFEQRKKYPLGRKIVIANKVLLEDEAMTTDFIPYQRYQNYIDPHQYWGISEVEQLESPQRIFNKLISFTLDVLTLMGNPIWIVSTDSNIDTDNLINRPGLVVEKAPGSEARREEGTQLQPYVMQLIDRMEVWFNDIAGTQDVSRGATPGSVTAASAIITLQEAAQTRLRQKSRNLDAMLQNLGQQYLTLALMHYDSPRVFRITNDRNSSRYFKAHIQEQDGELFLVVENEGELPRNIPIKNNLDVTVQTGTMLPFAKATMEQRLFQLYDRQIIDEEEVLKRMEYPNYEQILQRRAEAQQAAAQQQAVAG